MRVAWCSAHRGVMRISFFEPPPQHFNHPCPRCGEKLIQQVRTKYIMDTQKAKDSTNEGSMCQRHPLGAIICCDPSHMHPHLNRDKPNVPVEPNLAEREDRRYPWFSFWMNHD